LCIGSPVLQWSGCGVDPEQAQERSVKTIAAAKKLAEASLFKPREQSFPQQTSLPLDDQWLNQAYESTSIFTVLLVQYHPGYHAKSIDPHLAITGIRRTVFPIRTRRPALGDYVHRTVRNWKAIMEDDAPADPAKALLTSVQ